MKGQPLCQECGLEKGIAWKEGKFICGYCWNVKLKEQKHIKWSERYQLIKTKGQEVGSC